MQTTTPKKDLDKHKTHSPSPMMRQQDDQNKTDELREFAHESESKQETNE
jgi:hypothetical protein